MASASAKNLPGPILSLKRTRGALHSPILSDLALIQLALLRMTEGSEED